MLGVGTKVPSVVKAAVSLGTFVVRTASVARGHVIVCLASALDEQMIKSG